MNGIQEVSGSIPLISTISRERAFITRRVYAAGFLYKENCCKKPPGERNKPFAGRLLYIPAFPSERTSSLFF